MRICCVRSSAFWARRPQCERVASPALRRRVPGSHTAITLVAACTARLAQNARLFFVAAQTVGQASRAFGVSANGSPGTARGAVAMIGGPDGRIHVE